MSGYLKSYVAAAMEKDPAATSKIMVLFTYPGVKALMWHRPAHWLYNHKMCFLARVISQNVRFWTGIEIHPGAKIGRRLVIDHGTGIVVGETAEIGNNVTLYHGVTLGGTGKDEGKRHPTIGNNVLIGCGAKILGAFEVGDNCQIAANAGVDGSVIVENIKTTKKRNAKKAAGYGYDALNDEYCDMIERGIIDPTKVTRSALQNAASVAAMVLTTESLVADIPAPEPAAPAGGAGMGGMY